MGTVYVEGSGRTLNESVLEIARFLPGYLRLGESSSFCSEVCAAEFQPLAVNSTFLPRQQRSGYR